MATFLYRLGRVSFRKRHWFLLLWAAILAVAVFGAAKAPAAPEDSLSIPGTESQKAFDLMDQRFPDSGSSDGATARLVFVAPDGQKITASANKAAIEHTVSELADGSQVQSALDPFTAHAVSKDGTTAYATINYEKSSSGLTDATTSALKDAAQDARDTGLTVEIGGDALSSVPMSGTTELIGVAVAAVVLLITFGSVVAAGLPLITALLGIGTGVAIITALASTIGFSSTTTVLALMLGLAVGIDYALFILSRYRSERAEGRDPEEAAGRAVGTAGSAVVFAGLTVIIALVGLSVVGLGFLTKMGLAAAFTVLIAVLIALTLLPALLGFAPNAVLPRSVRKKGKRSESGQTPVTEAPAQEALTPEKPGLSTRWARLVIRRPLLVVLFAVVALGTFAAPALDLELGNPGDESKSTSTTERRAYDALSDAFGPGFNGPLTVVVDAKGSDDPKAAATTVADDLKGTDGVVSVTQPMFNKAGDTAVLTVTPSTAPASTETKELVHTIRDEADGIKADTGADMLVSGTTAVNIDMADKVTGAILPYLALVVGLAFLLLVVVFRSILVPLKAALGFLLSVCASFGVIVAVFQWGWFADLLGVQTVGPISSMLPIFLIGVVFGLAMDYEVFLVTRMREAYVHGERPGQAIVTGFRHSGKVVVAAAAIMMSVFAGFIGMSESVIKMMGVGSASAVFFDAFLVRMTIVPALLALLGDKAWWLPRWLQKVLPNVDVEGEKLNRTLQPVPAPVTHEAEQEPGRV
ncbi:MMPL family transporter [Streptomyces sp. NBC_00582]|uniref:MMPL family transporter n=1 Tax=Streptomyces sp. NBC_00582 TaxID=2975783 RepID=UPI002E823408|nr:MMPL family transporter [Streptomyces sp. NBC_00582]WUB67456.1 MMPL family transporter [Streptomyces sp. NBC_00582]